MQGAAGCQKLPFVLPVYMEGTVTGRLHGLPELSDFTGEDGKDESGIAGGIPRAGNG